MQDASEISLLTRARNAMAGAPRSSPVNQSLGLTLYCCPGGGKPGTRITAMSQPVRKDIPIVASAALAALLAAALSGCNTTGSSQSSSLTAMAAVPQSETDAHAFTATWG